MIFLSIHAVPLTTTGMSYVVIYSTTNKIFAILQRKGRRRIDSAASAASPAAMMSPSDGYGKPRASGWGPQAL